MSASDYMPTIGIETHVQLKTATKLFAAVGNDAREAAPNTLISHICVGMPGALPVLNKAAVELTAKAAFALGVEPQKFSKFDRKHYFYPDLPKGYQITQYDQPLVVGGKVEVEVDGERKTINITRTHLEEDAGKNTHPDGADYSLVDLNRAGTPLLEIVSEPEIHSAAEAKVYARELWLIMKYAGVTDGDLYHGHVRFDVNISVSKDPDKPGIRTEIKNLNSFRAVEGAVSFEIKRQAEVLEGGGVVVQETRGWDEAKQKTTAQREKEEAHDYRYFPDPDLPPVVLDDEFINAIKSQLPQLPGEYRNDLLKAGIHPKDIERLLDTPERIKYIDKILQQYGEDHAKRITNLVISAFEKLTGNQLGTINVKPEYAMRLSTMRAENKISSNAETKIWIKMNISGEDPDTIATNDNLLQVSDEDEIEKIVQKVIEENPKVVADIKAGQDKAIGFLVGQVMKLSAGKANPGMAQELIRKHLG